MLCSYIYLRFDFGISCTCVSYCFQKPSTPQVELSLVVFNAHGPYSGV